MGEKAIENIFNLEEFELYDLNKLADPFQKIGENKIEIMIGLPSLVQIKNENYLQRAYQLIKPPAFGTFVTYEKINCTPSRRISGVLILGRTKGVITATLRQHNLPFHRHLKIN